MKEINQWERQKGFKETYEFLAGVFKNYNRFFVNSIKFGFSGSYFGFPLVREMA